jgi:hypothetical protein
MGRKITEELPSMPRIPIDLDDKTLDFLKGYQEVKQAYIEAARIEDGTLHIFASGRTNFGIEYHNATVNIEDYSGETDSFDVSPPGCLLELVTLGLAHKSSAQREAKRRESEFYGKVTNYMRLNENDIKETVSGIRIFQGSLDEVQSQVGMGLSYIDTGTDDKFVSGGKYYKGLGEKLWLRVAGHKVGAELLVNYNPEANIATPVRYVG